MIAPTILFNRRRNPRFAAWRDEELVEACLEGREEAWNELVERYGRLVYSIPRRNGCAEADSEDIFQVVFTKLYCKLDTLRDRSRLSSWLISTTVRECRRLNRRPRHWCGLDDDGVDPPVADDTAARWEHQQLVRQALRELGGRCERLLTALFRAPHRPDYEAIARELDMKVGSIGPTRSRCFKKLEAILVELGFDEELHLSPAQKRAERVLR